MNKIEIFDKIEKVTYITQPSPVILVSTIDNDGTHNLAPFAMFMNCSTKPSMIAIAISPKTDTYRNIKQNGEFVIGIPSQEILDKMYLAGEKYNKNIDEFEKVGLTKYKSPNIGCARILECVVNIDCKFENELETGNHMIIVGNVLGCDIDKEKYNEDKTKLRMNIPQIYHITKNQFIVNGEKKEVKLEE